MDVFELQAKISVDTAPYLAALRAAASETETLRRSMSAPITPFGGSTPATPGSGTGGGGSTPSTPTLPTVTNQAQEAGKAIDALNKKLGEGFKMAAKIGAAAWGTFSAAAVAATKKAFDGFAQYEQLVGGVDTIFKESSQRVQEYAEQAYKTAGMSANQYMETVTGFSMSLLQSLEGDTEKAAEYADLAIRDMSDNANKMGTAMGSIQYAYQGFAKQNYTMLDNLKLGYGGTKAEMERLLEDAGKLANTKFDIKSYSDVIQAIHTIQENLDITGTTAKEASETIEGSMNSTKAAIDNLIVGFGRSDADLDKLFGDVEENVRNLAKNAIPVAERAFVAMSKTAIDAALKISEELPSLIGKATADVHKMIANNFGDMADKIFLAEGAAKTFAATFIAIKATQSATQSILPIVDAMNKVNAALKTGTTLSEAFAAANLANPILAIAAAATAVTVALKSWVDVQTDLIDEATDSYDLLNDRQKETVDNVREMSKSIADSRSAWSKTSNELENNSELYKRLTAELYKLDEQENIGANDKERMKLIVGQLNSEIEGLNITLNEETGHLETQKSTIDALIASYERQAKAKAYQERIYEITKQQIDVEKNLNKATREREGAYNKLGQLQLEQFKAQKEFNEFTSSHNSLHIWGTETEAEYQQLKTSLEKATQAVKDQESVVATTNETWRVLRQTNRDNIAETKDYTTALADMGGQANTTSIAISGAMETATAGINAVVAAGVGKAQELMAMQKELRNNTVSLTEETAVAIGELIDDYNDMYYAQRKAIEGSVDLFKGFTADTSTTFNDLYGNLQNSNFYINDWATAIQQLGEKGISQGLLDELKSMGLDSWNIVYDLNHATAGQLESYSKLWEETQAEIAQSTDELMSENKRNVEKQLAQYTGIAGAKIGDYEKAFKELGIATGDGLAKGIKESIKNSDEAVELMGYSAINSGYDELDVHSPSKKFEKLGNYVVEGFALGMTEDVSIAENAAKYLAIKTYNAMVEALDIHSPSKVMRKLGGFTGEGFAIGMSEKENAVLNASQLLAQSAVEPLESLTPIVTTQGANGGAGGAAGAAGGNPTTIIFNLDGQTIGRMTFPTINDLLGRQTTFDLGGYASR